MRPGMSLIEQLSTEAILQHPLVVIESNDAFLTHWTETYLLEQFDKLGWSHREPKLETFSWQALSAQLNSQDLFQTQTVVRAHCPSAKWLSHKDCMAFLQAAAAQERQKILLLLPKLTPAEHKSKAVAQLKALFPFLTTSALNEKQSKAWFAFACKSFNIPLPMRSQHILCAKTEHTPLRLWQCLQHLALEADVENMRESQLEQCILTSSQELSIFTITNALFQGKSTQLSALLSQQPIDFMNKAFWVCLKQLRTLVQHKENQIHTRTSPQSFINQLNLWSSQKTILAHALRLPLPLLQKHLLAFCKLEWSLKGIEKKDFTTQFYQRMLAVCTIMNPQFLNTLNTKRPV